MIDVSVDAYDPVPARRLQILMLAHGFPPAIGGVERYNWELCRSLARRGHAVSVQPLDPGIGRAASEPMFRILPAPSEDAGISLAGVARAALAMDPQFVLVSRFSRALAPTFALLRRQKRATFVFAHGLRASDARAHRTKRWRRRRLYGFDHAETVFANSEHTRRRLLRLGVSDARLELARPGVDGNMGRTERQRRLIRARYGLESKQVLLTVARLAPEKRIDAMIRLLPWVLARCPRAHYLVVGEGRDRGRLEGLAKPLARHVTFVGAQGEMAPWYSAADVYVHLPGAGSVTGYAGESFGMACAEASACSLPVVATAVGGLPEVVKHGATGMLVDPENDRQIVNSLTLLLDDTSKRIEFGSRGRSFVTQNFTWERCARAVDRQLQRVRSRRFEGTPAPGVDRAEGRSRTRHLPTRSR